MVWSALGSGFGLGNKGLRFQPHRRRGTRHAAAATLIFLQYVAFAATKLAAAVAGRAAEVAAE